MEKETSAKMLTSTSNSSFSSESMQSTMPSLEAGRNERCALTVRCVYVSVCVCVCFCVFVYVYVLLHICTYF